MHTLEQLRAGELAGATRLRLACGLTEFPREIFDLADTLEILDLSGNALSTLPDDLPRLAKLRILFCSDNQFIELPKALGACPELSMVGFKANRIHHVPDRSLPAKLRWLILTGNELETLPAAIGDCAQLQKLMLAGNRLRALPEELAACSRLELLRIAANRLTELPSWLAAMPRLAWLAYAGNPFSAPREATAVADTPIDSIAWDDLAIQHQLGEGASGVIHQARHRHAESARPVAVKLFKGDVTSDGSPQSEMAACVGAGAHPNLIPVRARVHGHPAGTHGLVMSLIDPAFGNLAGPPSLDSCTRDVYPPAKRFELDAMLAIAHGIASAAGHLHRRGIMHGDLYGHNILHCGRGRALLGDFGAASFYDPAAPHAAQLERLEVRAFGHLLDELLERCDAPAASLPVLEQLQGLASACRQSDHQSRPLFGVIESQLGRLRQTGAGPGAA
ncbi:leucine-rich repeat-containing protein kinase family protein [Pseudoduganella namucuonensis]|uniref:Protein kinase domain-containing protein n=1 Tax=Pseudoduganella namucuonensis TaxID=1035707 RepID=A0A1I7LBA1_9BURK|nr:leucine-rich repeat-containing protein kinase family protein [Pseudoduganella namucuonensis]SFV06965.1 Protein kinase domain-containing protein [Pseudoduganella namucuonensis]